MVIKTYWNEVAELTKTNDEFYLEVDSQRKNKIITHSKNLNEMIEYMVSAFNGPRIYYVDDYTFKLNDLIDYLNKEVI